MPVDFDAVAWAGQRFEEGYNCGESVLMALSRAWALGADSALATGFGGGLGRQGHTCGALLGGVAALGLRARAADLARGRERGQVVAEAAALVRWFEGCAGTVLCREITGCDLSRPEGMAAFKEKGTKARVCVPLVRAVVEQLLAFSQAAPN